MSSVADIDTPAVTVHLDVMESNIRRVHGHLATHGIANRPHIKTHKIPAIGTLQMQAGATGITCQKLGEVEVFTDAGVADDVLLTFNVLGRGKTERLMALSRRLKRISLPLCLRARVTTSGRRWESRGVLRTILLMWRLRLAYFFGAKPDELARLYQR